MSTLTARGQWDDKTVGRELAIALICRGQENEVANTSSPWLPQGSYGTIFFYLL